MKKPRQQGANGKQASYAFFNFIFYKQVSYPVREHQKFKRFLFRLMRDNPQKIESLLSDKASR